MEKIKTLFISDVHLGNSKSRADKLIEVLKKYEFEKLVIAGDFIDLTSLKRKYFWHQDHSTVIQKILRLSRKNIEVVYIIGNHDFYIRSILEGEKDFINFGGIKILDSHTHITSSNERIYICHGDQFDGFVRLHPFLYVLGDRAYEFSFRINNIYNYIRNIFGLNYWSLSAYLKSKVKGAISFVNDFKKLAILKIENEDVDSIMIGHIHTPAVEKIGEKNYYNIGDFCESCSYLIEDMNGKIELRYE